MRDKLCAPKALRVDSQPKGLQTQAIGVDGCRGGWIAVSFVAENGPGSAEARFFKCFSGLLKHFTSSVMVIDMPIGFVRDGPEGRNCDKEVRERLGSPRKSSVFTPPCRKALYVEDYCAAKALNFERTGKSLSKQTWAIVPKMREVDTAITPNMQDHILEGHPEIAFALAVGEPMKCSKAKLHGHFERFRCLHDLGFDPAQAAGDLPENLNATIDDLLDACVLSHVAQRSINGKAQCFGDNARDDKGLLMAIWG